jgi:hypothetical protein
MHLSVRSGSLSCRTWLHGKAHECGGEHTGQAHEGCMSVVRREDIASMGTTIWQSRPGRSIREVFLCPGHIH